MTANTQIAHICQSLSLPQSISTLATSILSAPLEPSYDLYYPYASIYVAAIASAQPAPSIPNLLSLAQPTSLYVKSFLQAAKQLVTDAQRRLPTLLPNDPRKLISAQHHAFSQSSELWRKLSELLKRHATQFHILPNTQRTVWMLLLVTAATSSSSNNFHLLLSCIVELGIVRSNNPYDTICEITGTNPEDVKQCKKAFNSLPSSLLPISIRDAKFLEKLEAQYSKQAIPHLDKIFIDDANLLHPPLPPMPPTPSSSPLRHSEGLTTPRGTPMRKRPMSTTCDQTPNDWKRPRLPVTPKKLPSHFAGYNSGDIPKRDALDTLAELACTTPRTPLQPNQARSSRFQGIAGSAAGGDLNWLQALANLRPETADPLSLTSGPVNTTEALKSAVQDTGLWLTIVERCQNLSHELQKSLPDVVRDNVREALAVYFSAIEGCLVYEASRLGQRKGPVAGSNGYVKLSLPRNSSFHRAILTCAWETVSAAHGRRDSSVFMKAMEVFDVSALEMTKVIESFAKRLAGLPKSLANHIIVCEHRLLEFTAWKKNSELVTALVDRVRKHRQNGEGSTKEEVASATSNGKGRVVTEFALEVFFRKLMYIASDRITELLSLLRVDGEDDVTKVWETVKVAAFERWPVMVDRHLDQVLLCSVYAVCKVLRYSLRFKDIMAAYRSMTHVKQPSFSHLIGTVSYDVSLDAHHELIARTRDHNSPSRINGKEARGDVIKFYNQVYIHAMRSHLVEYQSVTSPRAEGKQPSSTNECCKKASKSDKLHETIMNSPLHKRAATSPRRIGKVTVQLTGRALMALRQSPGRSVISPSARTMYSFGESPVKNLDKINRSVAQPPTGIAGSRNAGDCGAMMRAELRIDGTAFTGASASIQEAYADVLTGEDEGSSEGAPGRTGGEESTS